VNEASGGGAAPPNIDVGEYCRRVEEHLTRVNGGHLVRVVGPGFELVREWAETGIPLSVVYRGIDLKAERHKAGKSRRPLRIEFCEPDVRDIYESWKRAVGLSGADSVPVSGLSAETAEPRRRSLTRHLDRAIDRLSRAAGVLDLPVGLREAIDRALQELVAMRDAARKARGQAREDLAARLTAIETDLTLAARTHAPPSDLTALTADAEAELGPYRTRLGAEAWQRSIDLTVDRLLRDRYGLPVLVL